MKLKKSSEPETVAPAPATGRAAIADRFKLDLDPNAGRDPNGVGKTSATIALVGSLLAIALMGNLRPGDELLSIAGKPYDTLEEVIGIRPSRGSLAEYGVKYRQVNLHADSSFDFEGILHESGPEIPVGQIVPFSGGDDSRRRIPASVGGRGQVGGIHFPIFHREGFAHGIIHGTGPRQQGCDGDQGCMNKFFHVFSIICPYKSRWSSFLAWILHQKQKNLALSKKTDIFTKLN